MRTSASSYRMAIAARYWHSARIVLQSQVRPVEFMEPVAYLLAMACELTLKAYLTDCGFTDAQLGSKKIGHDLGVLLSKAIQAGLELTESEASCVLSMRPAHRTHFNRYGPKSENGSLEMGAFPATDEQSSLAAVGMLIDRVAQNPNVLRELHGRSGLLEWPLAMPTLQPVNMARLQLIEAHHQQEADKMAKLNAQFKSGIPRATS